MVSTLRLALNVSTMMTFPGQTCVPIAARTYHCIILMKAARYATGRISGTVPPCLRARPGLHLLPACAPHSHTARAHHGWPRTPLWTQWQTPRSVTGSHTTGRTAYMSTTSSTATDGNVAPRFQPGVEPSGPSMHTEVPGPASRREMQAHAEAWGGTGAATAFVVDTERSAGNYIADIDGNVMLDCFGQIGSYVAHRPHCIPFGSLHARVLVLCHVCLASCQPLRCVCQDRAVT